MVKTKDDNKAKQNDDVLRNWYDTPQMKKMNQSDAPKYDYSNTDIEPDSRILCVGTTKSGKTNSLIEYIKRSDDVFSRIIVYYKEMEKIYEFLNEALDGQVEFHDNLHLLPTLKEMRKGMTKQQRILLVIDDWIHAVSKGKIQTIGDYFTMGRKHGIKHLSVVIAVSFFSVV